MNDTLRIARRRLGVVTLCALVGFGGLPVISSIGNAAADFGAGQTARYNKNVNGDFLLVGNTALKCSGNDCTSNNTTNDDLNMVNNDPDGNGALFNGSSATFTIPSGSLVDAAYLYWGANLGTTRNSGSQFYCSDDHAQASNTTADKATANTVQLKVGAGSYTSISADTVYTQPTGGLGQSLPTASNADGLVYEGVKDVTSSFASVAAATSTTVSVANIQAMQGENCHAGWSLTVVYRFPAFNCLSGAADNAGVGANARNDYRNVAIYDGFLRQQDGAADTTTTLSGFLTAQPGPDNLRLGAVAWEGDQFLEDDQMKVKSNLSASATAVNPAGPSGTDNFFDSGKQTAADHNADLDDDPDSGASIQQGYTAGRGDGHGLDAKTQPVQVPGGTSSIDVTFTTDSDQYYPGQFALSSPLKCLLILDKDQAVNGVSVARDNSTSPAPFVKAGDVLTYTMPVRVAGDVDLTNVVISDDIPANTTYVAGSLKVGTGLTAAAATAALAAGGSFAAGEITAPLGTLNNLTGATCATGDICFATVRFQVTVDAGVPAGTVITNLATATFTASGVAINEVSNPVTDRVGALLTITKAISGAVAGDPTSFSFTVSCNEVQIAGSPVSLSNGGSVTLPVPTGSSCTVTEATNANFAVSVTGAITTNGGATTMSQDRSVSFTNTRRFAKIVINKTANAVAGDPIAVPTFDFTVACPGVTGYPRSLQVTGTGSVETPTDIPFGVNCTVTETATPGWAQSGSQSVQPVDAAVESVSFTNTRQTGSLIINKSTVGGDGTFDFVVACDGTAWDVSRSITTALGTGQSTAVTGIPAGTSCTVTETPQVGWTPTAAPAGAFTIVAGQVATASFTNTRQSADLVITKAVSGSYAQPVSGSFDFSIDCGAAGVFPRTIAATSSANGTATVTGLPVGTTCTITETVPQGWSLDSSIGGNTNGRSITISAQGNAATFTNRHDVGSIAINKTIDQGSGTFRFDLTCGGTPVPGSPFDITINAPATTGSISVPNIATGSNCTVDENPNGSVSGDFVQITPASNGVVTFASTGADQTASFVDHRRVGDLVIKKVFPVASLGDPTKVFTFQWDCGPQPRTIGLKAGEQHTVSGIPTGTACNVSETAEADYTSSSAPAGGAITITDGANTVTVTNTRKTATLVIRKDLSPAADPGRFDLDVDGGTPEATSVGDDGATAVLTLPIGSHSLAESVTNGNPASLADYSTTIACLNTVTQAPVPVTDDQNVVLNEGATVVCTFTNTRRSGTLELRKVLAPADDPGTFDLSIDGTVRTAGAGNGGTTGAITVVTGDHTIGEAAAGAVPLSEYTSTTSCVNTAFNNAVVPVSQGSVNVGHAAAVVCTITNTRRTGTLEVRKVLAPADDPGTFDLSIDGIVAKAGAGNGGTTGAITVVQGDHAIAEVAAVGTLMTDYAAALSCIDTAHDGETVVTTGGSVRVDADDAVVCTFTNTRETGNLTLAKVVIDPFGDGHTFDLKADDVTVVDDAVDGSSGAVSAATGSVTVSESGADLELYDSKIVCVDGDTVIGQVNDGTTLDIEVTPNSNAVCTFTNTRRTGSLEVRKQLAPESDPGTFDLNIDDEVRKAAAGDGDTTGAVQVTPGAHVVSESGANGSDLADYDASLECHDTIDDEPIEVDDGSLDISAGAVVVCTFTNTRLVADLEIVKAAGSASVLPGGTATFTITVTNNGTAIAHDVVVSDPLPAGVEFLTSQDDVCGVTGTSCDLGDLAPGATKSFTISYTVDSDPAPLVVHNEVTVASPDDPSSPGDDADIAVSQLSIVKTGTPSSYAEVGDVLTYTYVVSNDGGSALTGVTVTDDRIDAADIDCNDAGDGNGQPLALAIGASATCTATYEVTATDIEAGSVDNVGTADSDQTPATTDTWSIPLAAMTIEKVATSAGPFALGDIVEYDITVTNTGSATLHAVRIIEAGVGAVLDPACPASTDGPGVVLAVGATVTCTATHVVTQADFDATSYTNVARASSTETPDVTDEATVSTPDPAVDLAVVKELVSASLVAGQQATYTLTVSNNGPAVATTATVTDTMPDGLTAISASGPGWSCSVTATSVSCTTASPISPATTLMPITVVVGVAVTATGSITNTAVVSGTEVDRDPTNNTSTVTHPVTVVEGTTVTQPTTTTSTTVPTTVTPTTVEVRVQGRVETPLAVTGNSAQPALLFGGLLVLAGAFALGLRRRRSR